MPEASKLSSDWRSMDATFLSGIEALYAARFFVRNRIESHRATEAVNLLTPPEAPGHFVNEAECVWLSNHLGYRPENENLTFAEMRLDRALCALRNFRTSLGEKAHKTKADVSGGLQRRVESHARKAPRTWFEIRERLIANVDPIPSANDNLLLIRGIGNTLIKKLTQFLRPGAESFAGHDRFDDFIRYGTLRFGRVLRRIFAIPFLRFSPSCARSFLRGLDRFWLDIIVAPGLSAADLRTARNGAAFTLRPSALATASLVAVAGLYGLMSSSAAIEIAAPRKSSVAMIAADPIVTGALARRTTAARVARCSMRAWGKACYPRRSRP